MAYTPTPWVDGTTPVNAANLNKIETGLSAADALAAAAIPSAQKAAANGVATLGADGKVPAGQLPSGLGGGVDYIGDWGAGVTYKQGDVARYQGVDYLAVNPSTGQTPPALAPLSYPLPSYGLTLPASPQDGQEAILVDSLTNPSYQWRFRWNAGSSSPYKWEFVGGTPAFASAGGAVTLGANWTNPGGPSITVARAGEYMVSGQAIYTCSAANVLGLALYIGGTLNGAGQALVDIKAATSYWSLLTPPNMVFTVGAGQAVALGYNNSPGTGTTSAQSRYMSLIPVRVA